MLHLLKKKKNIAAINMHPHGINWYWRKNQAKECSWHWLALKKGVFLRNLEFVWKLLSGSRF